ncbi:MAG: relaxase/mobilization nuclease domain-containing protein [Lachnospiraceae bacterium]|nr:relaxase/mobilization nuclease domain-containing protein [Lachnospiraceae bacterium]
MAITKVLHMSADFENVINSHLDNSINYILQEKKLGEAHLSAGINCMVSGAYEQMMETKEMFGKTGGRQGYHFIISLKPGEGTPQEMYEIAMKFAERAFHNEYETVVAVHTDKAHIHAHVIINSVNMVTGYKFQYRKGDWKRIYQPITNELCKEYGLSIIPAEYSKEPSNMPRNEYKQNQRFHDFIRKDCESLLALSEDTKHFIWLLRELGYEVKEGVHIAVKVPGMKRFARLDTIDKRYARENLEQSIAEAQGREISFPVRTFNTDGYRDRATTPYRERLYYQMRGVRIVEKYRFSSHAARYYKDILWLEKWQEEYIFLCNNNIRSFGDLVEYRIKAGEELDRISEEQKKIYRKNAALKRKCTTPAGDLEYQMEHLRNEYRLARLKKRAKELRKGKSIVEHHMARSINAYLERIGRTRSEESLEIDSAVADVPEYPLAVARLREELKRQEEQKRQEAERETERQKQERFRKLYEEMLEKGERMHKKALDLPYDSKYMWEYIDYLDGRMFAPMEKFTVGELKEPFLTYEEFAGQKEQERAEQKKAEITITEQEQRTGKEIIPEHTELTAVSDKEITGREESLVKKEEVSGQDKPYKMPEQYKEKPEEQKELPTVSDVQIRKKSENSVQTERKKAVTKQDYERMTGKEKAEWLGISESDVNGSINRYKEKMEQIGIHFDSLPDMTEAFLKVWRVASQTWEKSSLHEPQRGRQR